MIDGRDHAHAGPKAPPSSSRRSSRVAVLGRGLFGLERPDRMGVRAPFRRAVKWYLDWNRSLVLDPWLRYFPTVRILRSSATAHSFRVLDVGCGNGDLATFLGRPIVGVDLTFTKSEIQRAVPHLSRIRASATSLPFRDRSFDCVVSMDMLEHIPAKERSRAVRELFRVAGRLIIIGCPFGPWSAAFDAEALREEHAKGMDLGWREEHVRHGTPYMELHTDILKASSRGEPLMQMSWIDQEGLIGLRIRWKLQFLIGKDSRIYGPILGPLYWIQARLRPRRGYRRIYVGHS